jgi:hypothetical protein
MCLLSLGFTADATPAGIPGFAAAPCLGYGKPVEEAVAHLVISGLRDGSWLLRPTP